MEITPAWPREPTPAAAHPELSADEQSRMVAALRVRLARAMKAEATLFETHISYVIVCGDRAYKIKKALRTAYLDNSTCAKRQHACNEELRLNRRLAAALYLGVVPVGGSIEAPALGNAGPALDWAVQMRSFTQDGLWDRLAARQRLGAPHIDELVPLLVSFHAAAEVAGPSSPFGTPAQVRAPLLGSLDELDAMVGTTPARSALSTLRAWEREAFAELAPVMAARRAQGRVRECHGDLHLGNVTTIDGRATVFDGIEFNDDFRWIDVMSELAFLAMDLHAHGLTPLAHRLVNAYLEASGDHDGARMLGYYLVHRALVRAKVAWMRAAQCSGTSPAERPDAADVAGHQAEAMNYLELAVHFSRPGRAALLITHGLSGSGKSTLTQGLLEQAGAIRLRADVERKRQAGLQPAERNASPPGGGLYSAATTEATYAHLRALAAPMLAAGHRVILDATFLRRAQRDDARRLAVAQQVPFIVLDFEVDEWTLRERVRRRASLGADASDADTQVLDAQIRSAEPLQSEEGATVFRVRPLATPSGTAPQADWALLLRALGPGDAAIAPVRGPS